MKEAASVGGLSSSIRLVVSQIAGDDALCIDRHRTGRVCVEFDCGEPAGPELEEDSILNDGVVFGTADCFRGDVSLYIIRPAEVPRSGS
jgi:hypothetical protein